VVLELRLRVEDLPEPLRSAFDAFEGDALVLPAELHLRRAD
jgi:hypothetical protein